MSWHVRTTGGRVQQAESADLVFSLGLRLGESLGGIGTFQEHPLHRVSTMLRMIGVSASKPTTTGDVPA